MNPHYWTLFGLFGASLAGMLALTPLARRLAARVGLIDTPDGRRKIHPVPIPVAGGLAILTTCLVVLALAVGLFQPVRELFTPSPGPMLGLLLGAVVICLVGVADDHRQLRGRHKLLGQLAAVLLVMLCGVRVEAVHLFGWRCDLGVGAWVFTMFWLLGAINSLNLIDGMDGLLGSVGTIICLGVALMSAWVGHWPEACVAAALAGALCGFLCFNLPPASIYLGDAGSMLIGLVIGVLAIRSSLKGPATVALAAPTALLIIPILDTTAAILRRKLTGRSIYTTDRGHLHHVLLDSGLSRPMVLLLVSGLCVLTFVGVMASVAYQSEVLALTSAAAVVAILVATRLFGHVELMLVLKSCGALARSVTGRRSADGHEVQVRLQGSADWGDLWGRLLEAAEPLNLRSLSLDINAPAFHEGYHARWVRGEAPEGAHDVDVWSADLPLTANGKPAGRVVLSGYTDDEAVWRKMAVVGEVAEQIVEVLEQWYKAGDGGQGVGSGKQGVDPALGELGGVSPQAPTSLTPASSSLSV
jgi:UDP-GlcNAc:undecaprenyl-phosphate/decaprenyl-phosphate GlcNAc-1-phosphate transferase